MSTTTLDDESATTLDDESAPMLGVTATLPDEPVTTLGDEPAMALGDEPAAMLGDEPVMALGATATPLGGPLPPSAARPVHPAVAAVTAGVDAVVDALDDLDGWAAVDVVLAIEQQAGRMAGASARLLARVEADGLWALSGGRSITDWLAVSAGLPRHRAKEQVALSRALRDHLPATEEAVLAGEVPVAQAQTLARYTTNTDARQAALAAPAEECGEEFLLRHAKEQTADRFRGLVRRWAAAADPAADERGYKDAADREFLVLAPTTSGVHLAGFLTGDHGAVVASALEAVTTPRAGDDRRTTQQRRAGALVDLAKLTLEHGLTGTASAARPHVSVVVDYDTLTRVVAGDGASVFRGDDSGCTVGTIAGPGSALFRLEPVADVERFAVGEIVGAGPVPPSVLARLACDSEISRIVFGPGSQVINVGRAERVFSGPRRRSIIARDGTCRYPGCDAPPALCEVHHIDWWARDGGETDANAGVLLCWHHHGIVHSLGITIARSPSGGWSFTTRHGQDVRARC